MTKKLYDLLPFIYGKELTEHVLVNNWSNGWMLPMNSEPTNELTIVVFFLPQLLQFFGFALLPIHFIYLLWTKKFGRFK